MEMYGKREKGKKRKKHKIVISLMKDELGGKIMKEFLGLTAKTYSYLTNASDEIKKAKGTKNVQQKENLNLKIMKTI